MEPRLKHNAFDWLDENKDCFLPPVCNKSMHRTSQLDVFFVSGPNVRKDYHLQEGEEFFYMLKGDMCLKVVEKGKLKDMIIKEGEVFMLPRRILHSPQRKAKTLGMVIERKRVPHEVDCLRFFVDGTTRVLYQRWFQVEESNDPIKSIINDFFQSEEYKTGKPQNMIEEENLYEPDNKTDLELPFRLKDWLHEHREEIKMAGCKRLFKGPYLSKIVVYGPGLNTQRYDQVDTFLWQLEGSSVVKTDDDTYHLKESDTLLVLPGKQWSLQNQTDGFTLSVVLCVTPV